jgi:hypothetical protein
MLLTNSVNVLRLRDLILDQNSMSKHDDNPNNDYELDLKPITIEELTKSIKYHKVNKPVGSDGIPAKFCKIFSDDLSPIQVYLFNFSLKNG